MQGRIWTSILLNLSRTLAVIDFCFQYCSLQETCFAQRKKYRYWFFITFGNPALRDTQNDVNLSVLEYFHFFRKPVLCRHVFAYVQIFFPMLCICFFIITIIYSNNQSKGVLILKCTLVLWTSFKNNVINDLQNFLLHNYDPFMRHRLKITAKCVKNFMGMPV